VLKYLGRHPALRDQAQPQISFNYLGQLDQDLIDGTWFRLRMDDIGPLHDMLGLRRHLITVSGSVLQGSLRIRLAYSANVHERRTIERLADDFLTSLQTLIDRGLHSEGTFTSGDFTLIEIAPTSPAERGSGEG
jgi:non-ribosomal peptide synthase protein (TIGR01720 family)